MLKSIIKNISVAINFLNEHILSILPYSLIFLITSSLYLVTWFIISGYSTPACIHDNYIVKLFVCDYFLHFLGKHILATFISALSIIPFSIMVYFVNNKVQKQTKRMAQHLVANYKGILKIIQFRVLLTIIVFLPFIIYIVLGGNIIKDNITNSGRLTIDKLLSVSVLPLTITMLLGFFLLTLAEPLFQYVEYEILINKLRLRDAIRKSYNIAMKHKFATFVSAFMFIGIWYFLILFKYLYLINNVLCIVTFAALFFESIAIFPLRTIYLYFLWKKLSTTC